MVRHLDVGLLCIVVLLIVCGLVTLYSATQVAESSDFPKFTRQILSVAFGLVAMAVAFFTPLRYFYKNAYFFYFVSLILLLLVFFIGTGSGARRWLTLSAVWIQPSELAKIATLLALARYLSSQHCKLDNLRDIIAAFCFCLVPFFMIMKQPDLGSALVFLAMILPLLHWGGLSPVTLFVVIAPVVSLICAFNYYSFLIVMILISVILFLMQRGLIFFLVNFTLNIGVGILTPIIWNMLKEYQKNRILTFLGIVTDPHGLSYQVIQSKVAIGSGGLLGKGFLNGTQTHLRFLPEQHTDFILCVIGEEFGFLGILVMLSLFFVMIYKIISLAAIVKNKFSSLVVFGSAIILLFQVFVNVGMTIGIMPVTGLPLPFISYGGSSLVTNMILLGLILNISRKRFEYL
jgi:rod shape determining protein RodA